MTELTNEAIAEDDGIDLSLAGEPAVREPLHGDRADPVAPAAMTRQMPGYIRFEATLTVHTRNAQRLLYGRTAGKGQAAITGLYRYAQISGAVCDAAARDDPYADRCLFDIEAAASKAEAGLKRETALLTGLLQAHRNIHIGNPGSARPATATLEFRTPYAHRAAQLVTQFDEVVGLALVARNTAVLGMMDFDALVKRAGHGVRGVLGCVYHWRPTLVTRDDFAAHNQVMARAMAVYEAIRPGLSALPDDILRGKVRPKFAPGIRGVPQGGALGTAPVGREALAAEAGADRPGTEAGETDGLKAEAAAGGQKTGTEGGGNG